jgi:hypothetical protein
VKHIIIGLLLTLVSTVSWSETWDCKQLRDVLVGPPFYVDQEETDLVFSVEVAGSKITILPDGFQSFACVFDSCRQPLSAKDFLIQGENDDSTFILSAVGGELGFRATYSVTSKPSVGETMIQMGVCSPSES